MPETIRVLIVDDERALLDVARIFLERAGGFSVSTAQSARSALDTMGAGSYDVIVSDYQMPGMDGIAFLKVVRERDGNIPFILFTGKGREEVVIGAINNGADFYLQKGGEPNSQFAELAHKIRQAVHRRKAELDRIQSEEKFAKVFLHNPSLEAITDFATGILIDVNEAYLKTTGYTREELVGKSTRDLNLFVDYADRERMAATLVSEGIVRNFETRIRTKAGEIRVLDFTGQRLKIGNQDLLFSQAIDITGRRNAEEDLKKSNEELNASNRQIAAAEQRVRDQLYELSREQALIRESENKYRELADLLPQMIFEIDRDFRITYINRQALTMFGFAEGEVGSGFYALSLIDPADHERIREKVQRQIRERIVTPAEYTAFRKDGSRFPVLIYSSPVFKNNMVTGFRGVVLDISERKKMENELREREKTFRSIFESSPYPVAINSLPDYRFLAINREFIRVSGYTEEDVLGKNHLELGLLSLTEATKLIARFAISGKLENIPLALNGKDGRRIHVLFSTVPVTYENHPALLTMTSEVTQLRRVEEELIQKNYELSSVIGRLSRTEQEIRASEIKFRALVENTLDGILIIGFDGSILFVNRAGGRIVDVDDYQEMVGRRNVMEFVSLDSKKDVMDDFATVAGGTDSYVALYKLITEKKREIWIESIGKMIPYGGTPVILLSIRDVTERKQAEDALNESRQLLAEAMDLAHLVNWEYDIATGLFTFDDHFYAMYGTTAKREGGYQMPAEVYTKEFVHLEDMHLVAEETEKAKAATDPGYVSQVEHRIVRRDGAIRHIVVRIGITKDSQGRTIKTHGCNQDITERKQAEDALRIANHQLNLLTGITRHDILNKVSVILAYLVMAERACKDPELATIIRNMRSATGAIQSQIEFTRVYQDLGTTEPRWIDLESVIPFPYVPVTISLDANVKGIQVYADPMLEKVFYNLLDNSVRHGERVSAITVTPYNAGGDLLIVWEDNGVGVPADEKDLIFERGYGKNTGLGLFLVREVLTLTSITITETGEPGTGARFEILVPKGTYRLDESRFLPRAP